MKRRLFALSTTVTALTITLVAGTAAAQTKWDLPAAYAATNFHTET